MDQPPQLHVQWADAEFKGIDVDYDRVRLSILEYPGGDDVVVTATGWIALSTAYFFDDSMVAAGRLIVDDPRIDAACRAIANRKSAPSGSPTRNEGSFQLLEVDLDDGARFECIAASFTVERAPSRTPI